MTRRDHADWIVPALVATMAVAIRLPNLGWGLPDIEEEALPLKKAFTMGGWDTGRLSLNPETAGWPSLSFYVHLLLQHLQYLVGRYDGRADFHHHHQDLASLVVAGRALGVLAAGIVVAVAVRLGRRLAGSWAGILAGCALAFNPLLYAESRMVSPDILLTALAALAVARLVALHEHGRPRDYVWAAVWIGLGASAKYSPVLLVPVLYGVHAWRERHPALTDRRLLWAAAACLGAFVLTSPYLLLDLAVLQRDVLAQVTHMKGGHFGHEDRAALFYFGDVLAPAFGWPGLVLATAGLGWAAWRRRGAWLVIAACAVAFYLGLGFLSTKFDRYMLPVLLPLALGLAAAVAWLKTTLQGRPRLLRHAVFAALAAAVLLPPAMTTWALARSQAAPGTLQLARAHLLAELERQDDLILAMEHYTPSLPDTAHVLGIPLYSVRPELADFYYDLRHFLPVDLIVTSGAVRGRFEQAPDRYPRQAAFYRDLERYAPPIHVVSPGPRARGPEIRIHRLTPAGRERLLRDRGPLEPGFWRPYEANLHAPHFLSFVGDLAWHAYQRDLYAHADLFYEALAATTPADQPRVFMSPHVMARLQVGRTADARRMCEEQLAHDPAHLEALTLLGVVLLNEGDTTGAIAAWQRCLALAAADPTPAADQPAFFDAPARARALLADLQARLEGANN